MLTTAVAETMGRKVAAATRVPRERKAKLAQAVITLVKKAAWGQAASKAIETAGSKIPWRRIMPWLMGAGGVGAGVAGTYGIQKALGAKKPKTDGLLTAAGEPTGPTSLAGAGADAGKKPQQLFGGFGRKMLGRMNINPTEEAARTRAMRDITAGGSLRRQAHEERLRAIRSMFVQ